ncbi:hypothetical protein [Paenibacillus sp. MBLB4367]|uniref:hypothetical protein n=1 Tax=Paenibacillus sp. MBLB4367 TaxID=3384767 RepID=UPI0039080AE5
MSKLAGIGTALLISVCIALAMSIAFRGSTDSTGALAANRSPVPTLSDDNMVDMLSALPLQLSIKKADWHQSVLSVDLLMPSAASGIERVYRDLYTLSEFGFQTSNVRQVLVRVLEGRKEAGAAESGYPLLVAMDARKASRSSSWKREGEGAQTLQDYLQSHYRITYTKKWQTS